LEFVSKRSLSRGKSNRSIQEGERPGHEKETPQRSKNFDKAVGRGGLGDVPGEKKGKGESPLGEGNLITVHRQGKACFSKKGEGKNTRPRDFCSERREREEELKNFEGGEDFMETKRAQGP